MSLRYILGLASVVLLVPSAIAQQVGTCAPAQAEASLDIGNVRTLLHSDGPLSWRRNQTIYELPKGSGQNAIFVTSLWIGGKVGDSLHIAAARYGNYEFWPGPLDEVGNPPANCSDYDRIYRVALSDIQAYNRTGQATPDLAEWPKDLGAPVLDGDGNPDNYNLEAGDRPALVGHQMAWWVMNDRGNIHLSTDAQTIGLEVQVTAFAYGVEGAIGNTTFYRYKLIYKGEQPLEDTYVGFYSDPDFGNFDDDYIGVDTTLQLSYVYNADNHDDEHYGDNPGALGYVFLDGPLADQDGIDNNGDGVVDEANERWGQTSFVCIPKGGGPTAEPVTGEEYYNNLKGLYRNGQPIVIGDNRNGFPTTRFCLPGKPEDGAFWSSFNIDGAGTKETPSDKRFSFSSGPFTMEPGDTQTITFAIVWSQGADHLDSVRQLRKDAGYVRQVSDALYSLNPQNAASAPQKTQLPSPALTFASNYPNPFSEQTTIRYSLPIPASVHLAVYDALGQEVAVLVDREQEAEVYAVPFRAEDLPPGVYFYRLVLDGHYTFTKAMLVVR